jgi:hypothetical protein
MNHYFLLFLDFYNFYTLATAGCEIEKRNIKIDSRSNLRLTIALVISLILFTIEIISVSAVLPPVLSF